MKNKIITLTTTICILALLLTSCASSTTTATSWGGATVTDSAIYYADGTQVYALKIDNGNTIWGPYPEKAVATRLFLAAPAVVEDQVLFGDYSGLLTSLNTSDGTENWQFSEATGKYIDTPLIVGDTIVAPNSDHNLYALDLNGNLIWTFSGEHSFWAQPVSDGTTIFAPCMDHYLYAVDLATGTEEWKVDLNAALVGRPTLVNGILYIGSLDSNVFAVNSEDGSILWEQKVAGGIWSAPIFYNDQLFFGDQTGDINILNISDGSVAQTISTESSILGSGAILTEGIAFGNENGDLILIGFDGEKKWTRSIDGSIYSNLSLYGNTLAVIANKGEKPLVAFDMDGNENWYFTTK